MLNIGVEELVAVRVGFTTPAASDLPRAGDAEASGSVLPVNRCLVGEYEGRPFAGRSTLDVDERTEKSGDERALRRRDSTHRERSVGRHERHESGCEFDDCRSADIRHDNVEWALALAQRRERRSQLAVHAVEQGVPSSRLDRFLLHTGRHDPRRPEPQRSQPEHATATAEIEDAFATGDLSQRFLDEQPCRRMLAIAGAPRAELDLVRQAGAVVL